MLIGSGAGPKPGELDQLDLPAKKVFCHVVAVAPLAKTSDLENLALEGSGAFFAVKKPARVNHLIHQAVRTALSPARLVVLAHDNLNKPLKITYGISRPNQLALRRRGISGRPIQVLPAVYKLKFPSNPELGPGPLPKSVSVEKNGGTRLWAGGRGFLNIEARGEKGEELIWNVRVARQGEGKMVQPLRKTPFKLELPADFYLVNSSRPPLSWTVELGAGENIDLVMGPPGSLTVNLRGATGPLRVPYQAVGLLGGGKIIPGYTGSPLRILPGPYRLKVGVAPPLISRVDIKPGAEINLELPPVGELLVKRGGPGSVRGFEVYSLEDRFLTRGLSGRRLPLKAGIYLLRFGGHLHDKKAVVTAGRLTTIEPPPRKPR